MHLLDYILLRIYQCYTPFGLFIGQNYYLCYTFWTICWSELIIIIRLLDYIYWSELVINTRHISLSFPFFLRAPIYLEPVASEEHKVLKVSKKGNSNHN